MHRQTHARSPEVSDGTPTGVICVLGMHRSGTSAATGVLKILGVSLGPSAELLPAAPDNPKGYSEHGPIVALNHDLLARLGGRAFAPPELPSGWESLPELGDLHERGGQIVRASFTGEQLVAWKDPRTCLTLPFWQRLMPPMRYVICVRHPADVARSLHRRNRVAYERSCYLWLLYTRRALSGTMGQSRCLVVYDRMIDNPTQECAMLASFIGTPARAEQPAVKLAVEMFLDANLRHHRSTDPDAPSDPPAARSTPAFRLAAQAYEMLARTQAFSESNVDSILASALNAVRPSAIPRPSLGTAAAAATTSLSDQTS
jgi:hypothetical protein